MFQKWRKTYLDQWHPLHGRVRVYRITHRTSVLPVCGFTAEPFSPACAIRPWALHDKYMLTETKSAQFPIDVSRILYQIGAVFLLWLSRAKRESFCCICQLYIDRGTHASSPNCAKKRNHVLVKEKQFSLRCLWDSFPWIVLYLAPRFSEVGQWCFGSLRILKKGNHMGTGQCGAMANDPVQTTQNIAACFSTFTAKRNSNIVNGTLQLHRSYGGRDGGIFVLHRTGKVLNLLRKPTLRRWGQNTFYPTPHGTVSFGYFFRVSIPDCFRLLAAVLRQRRGSPLPVLTNVKFLKLKMCTLFVCLCMGRWAVGSRIHWCLPKEEENHNYSSKNALNMKPREPSN